MAKNGYPLTLESATDRLFYDPITGILTWKERPIAEFHSVGFGEKWNKRYAGKEAFANVSKDGYKVGRIFNRSYSAHRICWLLYYGDWPSQHIDHIDGNPSNNAISNLRDASRSENMRNKSLGKTNKSGALGVRWDARSSKWLAHIRDNSKTVYLGYFDRKEDAVWARKMAEKAHGYHENHGRAMEHRR